MKEARFIKENKEKWEKMEHINRLDSDTLASNYVILSEDLSYARTFYPGSQVVKYLNRLITSYQTNIYGYQSSFRRSLSAFWLNELPQLIWQERKTLLFALIFFTCSSLLGAFSAANDENFVRLILGNAYVDMTLDNIERGTPMGVYNSADEGTMFFSITTNNIRVSFMAFIFGVLFSVGTLWILFSNGVMLGAFQFFFFRQGLLLHSALSVWAHGTFEITSIILAGGAGLIMGNSLLFPGTYSRPYSFREGALKGVKIIVGLIPFFIIAGAIESFVTRYADSYPIIGACTILFSLAGVISYFVLYPYYLNKTNSYGKIESLSTT